MARPENGTDFTVPVDGLDHPERITKSALAQEVPV